MNEVYSQDQRDSIAATILASLMPQPHQATVLCLQGDLGAGKTTLTQSIAHMLGITETVVSPTFVIAKYYTPSKGGFTQLVHIDAYRIENERELLPLGFAKLLEQPNTLIIIEWPERIKGALPSDAQWLTITHANDMRHIAST